MPHPMRPFRNENAINNSRLNDMLREHVYSEGRGGLSPLQRIEERLEPLRRRALENFQFNYDFEPVLLRPRWSTAGIIAMVASCALTVLGLALASTAGASLAGVTAILIGVTAAGKWTMVSLGIGLALSGIAGIAVTTSMEPRIMEPAHRPS
jgi:hypothetical protein